MCQVEVRMSDPLVSVIIPTRGRDGCLRQVLSDLAAQDFKEFDIWVVDQNDNPLKDLESGAIKLIHESMPPFGSHAGRNYAIFRTRAKICIFVDDDVRLEPGFVGRHVKQYKVLGESVGAISGRVIQPRDGYSEDQMRQMGAPARYNKWTGLVSGNFVGFKEFDVQHIHECNFSALTSVLRQIGGFNEEFKGNAYFEGADLGLRIIQAGFRIAYRPETVLTHLQDGAGGNRVNEKARHTYWFIRNYSLLGSLHMKRIGVPLFGAYGLAYVFGKALKNRDFEIARSGIKGLIDGFRYFLPGTPRLKIRR